MLACQERRWKRKFQKIRAGDVGLCFLFLVFLGFAAIRCSKTKGVDTIRIGCITPLTGNGADYGKATKRGLDLAADEINRNWQAKNRRLEIVYEDDQMNPTIAINAMKKLTEIDKVQVIIGGLTSTVTLALAPIAEKEKIILFSASATADSIRDAGEYVFRNVPTNKAQAETVAEFSKTHLKADSACILRLNTDYGVTLGEAFKRSFESRNGKVLSQESYNEGVRDFRAQLAKIRELNPDIVFFPGNYQESGLILKQARELGVKSIFVGGDGSYSPELIQIAGNAAEGSYYTLMSMEYGTPNNKAESFTKKFQSKYGVEPDGYAAYSYDALLMIAGAIDMNGYSADGIKSALYGMKGFKGVTGITEFDENGEVSKPFGIYKVMNGTFSFFRWKGEAQNESK